MQINAEYISNALNGKPLRNGGYECDCPLVDHRQARMVVSDKETGEPLIHCRAGCSFIDLQRELKQRGLWPKKNHTPEENLEIRRKIERKAWEKAEIWLAVYDGNKPLRTDKDEIKASQLTEMFKYKIWATKVFADLSKKVILSKRQSVVLQKARKILE